MKAYKKFLLLFSLFLLPILAGCESKLLIFDPKGPIARNLTDLIVYSIILMLVIIVVVYVLFAVILVKYRAKKQDPDFEPEYEEGNKWIEITWFTIPVIIVIALMIPTVKTIYSVEDIPQGYEEEEPLVVHVTSADWKWIFSYPDEDIETVNYLNIPADHPVLLKMTSAGTMQSFWVPELAGQKYTMANMETELYLLADKPGSFYGRNTNFNGRGYKHMEFEVQAMSKEDFNEWIHDVKKTAYELTEEEYVELLKPSVIGRKTYNKTHLEWIDHSKHDSNSEQFIHPELYDLNNEIEIETDEPSTEEKEENKDE